MIICQNILLNLYSLLNKNRQLYSNTLFYFYLRVSINKEKYSDDKIIELYRDRWPVEVFFKFIKNNFKFSDLNIKTESGYHKLYLCEQIITLIIKLLELSFMKKQTNTKITKNNKKNTDM